MGKTQISRGQFFVIVFSYIFANDLIRGFYAEDLKNNLWVPVLLGVFGAAIIFYFYSFIYKSNNYNDFTTSIENILGKFLSKLIFIIYPIYFLFMTFLNLRDIVEALEIFLLQDISLVLIGAMIIFVIFYITSHGIEVFSRLSTILFYVNFFIFVSFSFLIIAFNKMIFEYLFPILEHGIKPVLIPAYQMSYSIPYGELFVLLIIFQFVKDKKKGFKFGMYGLLLAGLVLLLITLYNILIVGPEAMVIDIRPSLRISKRIDVNLFLQRFDLIVINVMLSLMIIKLTVLVFASKHLINHLLKIKKDYFITLFICIILVISLMFLGQNYSKLLTFRKTIVIPYINLIYELLIPFALIIISLFRNLKLTIIKDPNQKSDS